MTFTESIQAGLSKLSDFSGRAGRSEYWWFSFFLLLVLALLVTGIVLLSRWSGARVSPGALAVLLVPLYLAWAAVQVRRLRDAALSPGWILLNLIPYAGVLVVLALSLRPSRPERDETGPGSLSTFSLMMATGWGAITGGGALTGEKRRARSRRRAGLLLTVLVLLVVAVTALVYVVARERWGKPPQAAVPAPAVTVPQGGAALVLMDESAGVRLYYDPSSARLAGPDRVSIQLVFDFAQAGARDGVSFRSMKQNEVFNCAARGSSWTTRFYMSEPLGEGSPVLIEDGKGSLLDMSDGDSGNQRLDAVCRLLPGLQAPAPAATDGR